MQKEEENQTSGKKRAIMYQMKIGVKNKVVTMRN
jgi:hypothetical protein